MKTKKLLAIILVLCFAVLALCGCVQLKLNYTEEAEVSFAEPYGYKLFSYHGGYSTQYEGVTYYFDINLSEEQRNEFVTETVAVMKEIQTRTGVEASEKIINVCTDEYEPRADEQLYLGYPCFKTTEYIVGLCKMVFGNEVNYGVLYGLANSIAVSRGYSDEQQELEQALTLCETAPEYLDLNYPCFLDNYADKETLGKVKTVATEFYSFLETNSKTDLITDYTSQKYTEYLNEFLETNGKPYYDNSDLNGIIVYGGGQAVRLIWETDSAVFYLMDNYEMRDLNEAFPEDFCNTNYLLLRETICNYQAQMKYIQDVFADYYIPSKVTVLFSNPPSNWIYGGVYYNASRTIGIYSPNPFMHEYIHYITFNFGSGNIPTWIHEVIANYHDYYFVADNINFTLRYAIPRIESESYMNQTLLTKIEQYFGKKIDYKNPSDYMFFNDATCYWQGGLTCQLYGLYNGAVTKPSYYNYLVGLVGQEEVVNAVMQNNPIEIFGKDWDELATDWEEYLRQEFAWVNNEF